MNYKKILAASLAATMVLGNAVVAFAADEGGAATGEGETQYVATSDVFKVVLPTVAEDATTFDYLLDPDGLIAKTSGNGGGRYTGTFEAGKTVYFKHATAVGGNDYTDTSDEIKVVNKSTQAVDLTVTAKVTPVDGITMAAKNNFTNEEGTASTDTELYLALVGTDSAETPNVTEKAITADGTELTASIPADATAYEVTWNATDKQYERTLTTAASAADYTGFKTYSFKLTGKCNTGEGIDWSGLDENAPKVDLVWSVKDFTVNGPQMTLSASGLLSITGLTAEQNWVGDLMLDADGSTSPLDDDLVWDTENYDDETGGDVQVQLGSSWMDWLDGKSATITLTLSDGNTVTVTTTLAK